MADKRFFDLLKDKMAALRPSEQHRDGDWAALAGRLEVALPASRQKGRRGLVLPLLLLVALLTNNAVWWQSGRNDRAALARLEAQVSNLQAAASAAVSTVVRTDTVWQTVYLRQITDSLEGCFRGVMQAQNESDRDSIENQEGTALPRRQDWAANSPLSVPKGETGAAPRFSQMSSVSGDMAMEAGQSGSPSVPFSDSNSTAPTADLSYLKGSRIALLNWPGRTVFPPTNAITTPRKTSKTTTPFGQSLLEALRPKFLKAGCNIGWLHANSAGLMHEGGFLYNFRGEIGLSRHWSVTADVAAGSLHYKAHAPEAVLGAPDLPVLPSMEHHFAEVDVTGQKIRQFDLGLRYTFAQVGKNRPYLGLGWVSQTVLPYTVAYEIQHEPSGTLQKGVFTVATRTRMRHVAQMNAGLEIPLSPRFEFGLEGFYQRQWKKPNAASPDLMGIRGGVNWSF